MEIFDEYVLGLKRYPVTKYDRAYEIKIRRDVDEEEIFSMVETILLAYPGTMNKNFPSMELSLSSDVVKSTNCVSLSILLGVKSTTKQRIIIIHFRSSNSSSKPKLNFLASEKPPHFVSFVDTVIDQCKAALESSGVTDGPYSPTSINSLDPGYVRDLQLVCGMDMLSALTKMAETMDYHVTILEKKCAKLMTLMKPCYTKAFGMPNNLSCMPVPPTKKSLLDYPLNLTRSTITEPNMEVSRLLILRAKRALDQYYSNNQTSTSDPITKKRGNTSYLLDDLVAAVIKEISLWVDDESKARTVRKTIAVKERVLALDEYRENLLWQLHSRYTRKYMNAAAAIDGLVIADMSIACTTDDEIFHDRCKALCRVFCDEEPVILDLPVSFQGKKGILYISVGHIHFEPSLLTAPSIPATWFGTKTSTQQNQAALSVIQVKSISDISIRQSDSKQIIVPNILASTSSAAAIISTPSTSSEEIVLRLYNSEESIVIQVPPLAGTGFSSADYCRRLADLINILVKADFYKKSRALLALPSSRETMQLPLRQDKSVHIEPVANHIELPVLSKPIEALDSASKNPFDDDPEAIDTSLSVSNIHISTVEQSDIDNHSKHEQTSVPDSNPFDSDPIDSNSFDSNPFDDLMTFDSPTKPSTEVKSNPPAVSIADDVIADSPAGISLMSLESNHSSTSLSEPGNGLAKKPSLAKNIKAFLDQNR